jgi:hypothetical protein
VKTLHFPVDWSVRCETPACQPPEYTSCKACDEEHAASRFACRRRGIQISLKVRPRRRISRRGGSSHTPRKARILEQKPTTFKSTKFAKTAKIKDYLYHLLILYISSRKKDILKKAKKGYLVIDMKMLCLL